LYVEITEEALGLGLGRSPEEEDMLAGKIVLLLLCFKAHQHKAAGRKTRLYIQNYGCNSNLLCYHGVVERNHISSAEPWKGVGKGMLSPGCLL